VNFAARYLQFCISAHRQLDQALVHALLWLRARFDADETGLAALLAMPDVVRVMDCSFALRVCKSHGRRESCVLLYSLQGFWEEAVDLALEVSLSLAQETARKPDDLARRRRLWLRVALYLISTLRDVPGALALLGESGGDLRIEDVLPHLPDFAELDMFKDEICRTLDSYGQRIDSLKHEMEELTESSGVLEEQLNTMKQRTFGVSGGQTCEECGEPLFARQFYLFPCGHGLHCDCMRKRVLPYLDARQRRAVERLEERTKAMASRARDDDRRALTQYEYAQAELDGYLAGECPLCGSVMIMSVAQPLVGSSEEDLKEAAEWEL